MQVCISNLVYGEKYTSIFLDYHLKSLIENVHNKNIIEKSWYLIFTDGSNIETIKNHQNYQILCDYFTFNFLILPTKAEYNQRYSLQGIQQQHTAKFSLEHNVLMLFSVADLYFGPNFLERSLKKIDEGYDAIVTHAMRVAFESTSPILKSQFIAESDELFEIGFANQHPLWVASNWNSPLFSKIPYHILWTDKNSILVRGFSLTPLLVRPQEWMLNAGGCTDITFMAHLKKPYISSDWHEFPSLELGLLFSFYPPFSTKPANTSDVASWAKSHIPKENFSNLNHYMIFKKKTTPINHALISRSASISREIQGLLISPQKIK
jgi:hypothetical protein